MVAEYVHKQLFKQRDSGVGVLLLSLDLDEILLVSDRIAVIYAGKIMGVFDRTTADVEKIGPLMGVMWWRRVLEMISIDYGNLGDCDLLD